MTAIILPHPTQNVPILDKIYQDRDDDCKNINIWRISCDGATEFNPNCDPKTKRRQITVITLVTPRVSQIII